MKTSFKTLLLIIIAIIILSAGPLIYFTRTPAQINLNQSSENFLRVFSGNVTGKVVFIPTSLSYVGVSNRNDDFFVREVNETASGISPGCTMRLPTLNPYGNGYRYEIVCSLVSSDDVLSVGFKLYNRLHYLFNQDFFPNYIGRVKLPLSFNMSGEVIKTTNTTDTASAILYYSELNETNVVIECPQIVVNPSNVVVKSPGLCVDVTPKGKLGLSPLQELFYAKNFNKTLELNVTDYYAYGLRAEAEGNKTNETKSDLITYSSYSPSTGKTVVYAEDFNKSKVDELADELESKGFTVEEYRIGIASMPSRISTDYSSYFVPNRLRRIKVKLGLDEELGVKTVTLVVQAIFDDVVNIYTY